MSVSKVPGPVWDMAPAGMMTMLRTTSKRYHLSLWDLLEAAAFALSLVVSHLCFSPIYHFQTLLMLPYCRETSYTYFPRRYDVCVCVCVCVCLIYS
jgi:hypothetical protein